MIKVFTRNSFRQNPVTKKLVPGWGKEKTLRWVETEEEARAICKDYNDNNPKGRFHKMAEFRRQ